MFRVAQALGRTIKELEETMDYAELKEWEIYFSYEPTVADRLEQQLAFMMHMLSGFLHKDQMGVEEFMVCHEKRPKKEKKDSSVKSLWQKALSIFGD